MTYTPTKEELEELGFEISIASNGCLVGKYYILNDSGIDSDDNIIYQKITIDYYESKEEWTMCSGDYSNSGYISFGDNFRLSVSCYEDIATLIKLLRRETERKFLNLKTKPMLTDKQELHLLMKKFNDAYSLQKVLKGFNIEASIDDIERIGLERYIYNLRKEKRREWFRKTQNGEIVNRYTPIKVNDNFSVPINPVVGRRYHLSWAFRGARFVLRKIDGDTIYLDNPKNRRASLLKAKKSDLRLMRGSEGCRSDELYKQ